MTKRVRVEVHPHAYLVIGTIDYVVGRRALARLVKPVESVEMATQFPCRPLYHPQYGGCVAFYFHISGLRVSKQGKISALRMFRDRAREAA